MFCEVKVKLEIWKLLHTIHWLEFVLKLSFKLTLMFCLLLKKHCIMKLRKNTTFTISHAGVYSLINTLMQGVLLLFQIWIHFKRQHALLLALSCSTPCLALSFCVAIHSMNVRTPVHRECGASTCWDSLSKCVPRSWQRSRSFTCNTLPALWSLSQGTGAGLNRWASLSYSADAPKYIQIFDLHWAR